MKKFIDLKSAIFKKLKAEHSDWTDKQLDVVSEEIALSQMQKKMEMKKVSKKDADGNIIVGENVKLILEANIASVGVIEE